MAPTVALKFTSVFYSHYRVSCEYFRNHHKERSFLFLFSYFNLGSDLSVGCITSITNIDKKCRLLYIFACFLVIPIKSKFVSFHPQSAKSNHTPPDLMEFLPPGLQKESPDFSLPGIKPLKSGLRSAPHEIAFDLYRHNRVWQGISDY